MIFSYEASTTKSRLRLLRSAEDGAVGALWYSMESISSPGGD